MLRLIWGFRLLFTLSFVLGFSVSSVAQESSKDLSSETTADQSLAFEGSYSWFNNISDWQEALLEYEHKTKWITGIGRTNYAHRFNESGIQFETDLYPKISKKMYAYINLGYSPSNIFPEFRYGGELYGSLPAAFELSAGFRRLHFETDTVTMYTGSVGKYFGNYWISLRPFITPQAGDASFSLTLFVRRYFSTADSYVTLIVGGGNSVTEIVVTEDLEHLSSYKVALEGKTPIHKQLFVRWSTGYDYETLTFDRQRHRVTLKAGLEYLW